ncbi:MAG TPA: nucleotidyltransferase domain-containing protein [bacterium]|nr:nucleotidyltransferase domain-containing protein [bacterium]
MVRDTIGYAASGLTKVDGAAQGGGLDLQQICSLALVRHESKENSARMNDPLEDTMFSIKDRERLRDRVLQLASSDSRVVAGAIVGSLAHDEGDRWSDLDLTFAVTDGLAIADVLDDWTRSIVDEFDATRLFDLPRGATIYRVFLLPGCLQFDLSFTPASEFAATSPKFRLLFGRVVEKPYPRPPSADELFGYAVLHVLHARFSIERGRYWGAEYWISGVRDYALSLACRRRDLPAREGRGFDNLPATVRDAFKDALVRSLERDELLRALGSAISGLLREARAGEVQELAAKVEPQLRKLTVASL